MIMIDTMAEGDRVSAGGLVAGGVAEAGRDRRDLVAVGR